jgi:hypothetical protein
MSYAKNKIKYTFTSKIKHVQYLFIDIWMEMGNDKVGKNGVYLKTTRPF